MEERATYMIGSGEGGVGRCAWRFGATLYDSKVFEGA